MTRRFQHLKHLPHLFLCLLGFSGISHAATCTVTNANDTGAGSLRQAITDANATTASDTVAFNIPGTGVATISITTALPAITQPLIINGTTQSNRNTGTLGAGGTVSVDQLTLSTLNRPDIGIVDGGGLDVGLDF